YKRQLLDSGSITSGKQLEEIQHEITSLLRRASEREDAQLEVMERAEGAQARVDELSLQIGEVQQEHAKVSAALEVAVTVIRADRADLDSQ
ncbi:CT398-like coiled coil hairpin domain-containing protein, partial [Staphylococcus aureus]